MNSYLKFFLISLFVIGTIHIFSSPTYFSLSPNCKPCPDCCDMKAKLDRQNHLLESVSNQYEPSSHMAKSEFRLAIPFLAFIFQIESKTGIYILQVLAGVVFFFVLSLIVNQLIPDQTTAIMVILGFAFIYPGYSFVAEMEGFFDSFAYLFILVAMMNLPIILTGSFFFLAFWTDERAIFAGLLVVFWWQYKQYIFGKNFFRPGIQFYAFIISLGLYLGLRWYLVHFHGFVNQLKGTGTLSYTIDYAGIGLWQAFEGFWLLLVLSVYLLFLKKQYLITFLFIVINTLIYAIGMNVMDITRSIAYIFPSILISIIVIKDHFDQKLLKQIVGVALVFSFIYPSYSYIVPKPPHAYHPIYMRVVKKLMHIP